jgi:hypothetical protein
VDTAQWALTIAGLSLLVSAGSLLWQIVTWFRQSARIRVELRWGSVSDDFQHFIAAVEKDLMGALDKIDPTAYPIPAAIVIARNRGRSATSVQDACVEFPGGYSYRNRDINLYAGLPGPLAPGEAISVTVPIAQVFEAWTVGNSQTTTIRGRAYLGSGKSRASRPLTIRRSDQPIIEQRFPLGSP